MIEVVKVKDRDEGNLKAHDILKNIIDRETLLALSGGTSPDYKRILRSSASPAGLRKMFVDPLTPLRSAEQSYEGQGILPGAICVVDERYGEPFHKDSNELLLKNSQVPDYCQRKGIDFYKILEGKGIEQTAEDYDQLMSELFVKYPKKVGIMGIGTNLHTAGIFPYSQAERSNKLVTSETVDDQFSQRITMTLRSFGEFQNFVILAFGPAKQDALRIMLDEKENDMQKYPAIFYRKCFAKSWLITDQDLK